MNSYSKEEIKIYKKLNTPVKIQDFLEIVPYNFESRGETCYSPRLMLRHRKAHCMEGALFAAACFQFHGNRPLILELRADKKDLDHIIAPFKINRCWGAISKTNHAVLRYREPVYKSIHELVMSYFHEYFLDSGKKTLRGYSKPVDLSRFDKKNWQTSDEEVWYIDRYLDKVPHKKILTPQQQKNLRPADLVEIKAEKITVWKK